MATTDTIPNVLAVASVEPPATIVLDPHRPGIRRARLLGYEVPIWALIGHVVDIDDESEMERTADDYNLPSVAVQAAVAFYRVHQTAIDNPRDTLEAVAYLPNGTPVR